MACVAVCSLMRTIELEFLQSKPRPIILEKELIPCNKELVQSLHQNLGFLIELFDENKMDGIQAIKDLETKLKDVAFRVEDEIEFQITNLYEEEEEEEEFGIADLYEEEVEEEEEEEFGIADLFVEKPQGDSDAGKTCHSCKLHCILEQAIEDIEAIKEELWKVKMEYKHFIALKGRKTTTLDAFTNGDEGIMVGDSSENASNSEYIMVGKNNEFQMVKKMLIEHPSRQREIVSIKGMGGIGKTTLAKRLYDDPSIAFHFDKRAWIVASQHHNKTHMLTDILESIGYVDSDTTKGIEERVYQCLMHQRYFIVIDDIWSDKAWDAIKICFPDNGNRSRVLLTTRFADVATRIGSRKEFSHQMHLLDQSESWNLFREKACKSRGVKFEKIGRRVVEKCKGLPLAIVVVAGLFSKLKELDVWKNIAETLNSFATTTIDEECSRMLSSSYNHLSYKLKACFLYLSIFPEDNEIHVKHLVKLWGAEGLVKEFKNMSLDAATEGYIQELNDRNLILVSQTSSCGRRIKAFRMHDLLHSFCVREAKKENLLHVVYRNGSGSLPKGFRWVSIQSNNFNNHTFFSSLKNCRSIYSSRRITSSNLKSCNLLRVLYNIECKIVNLVHLRCLFSQFSHFILLKPFRAWNLQSISILGVEEMNFLNFPQLQHFSCFIPPIDFPIVSHQNLKSICWLQPYECTKELFTNIPNLKKVQICGERRDCNDCIENLAYSQQLERVCIFANNGSLDMITINEHIVLLKNLTKLTFKFTNFEWKGINVLTKLPRLQVLQLFNFACLGEEWELSETEKFCELIVLDIATADLKHWKASVDHFPKLERLILYWCYNLEELPTDFAEISTLKSIELKQCLPTMVTSAREIEKEQHDYGNDEIVVIEENTILPEESVEGKRKRRLTNKKTPRSKNQST